MLWTASDIFSNNFSTVLKNLTFEEEDMYMYIVSNISQMSEKVRIWPNLQFWSDISQIYPLNWHISQIFPYSQTFLTTLPWYDLVPQGFKHLVSCVGVKRRNIMGEGDFKHIFLFPYLTPTLITPPFYLPLIQLLEHYTMLNI